PATGETKAAGAYTCKDGVIELPLRLDPYGSLFVVFERGRIDPVRRAKRNGRPLALYANGLGPGTEGAEVSAADGSHRLELSTARGGDYEFTTAAGRRLRTRVA